ncbi:MAG: sorbitol-6-phosphate dehydrogenase subunit [Coriobacteriia bacterium]|nr:sorbitol-6-phosphate dehydrogenase subunit [Coriobacteriia bacterium]
MSWLEMEDKVAIVTGGASGIGRAVVNSFVTAGAKVVVVDVSVETGDELDGAYCIKCNIMDAQSVSDMADHVYEKFGRIDFLINNAGINLPRLLVDDRGEAPEYEFNVDDYDKIFGINVKGAFLCAQACARYMIKAKSGVIINMSSESGKEGSQGQSIYAATKGAIDSATRSWAKELGKFGIRVVAVAPGIMEATGLRSDAYEKALAYTRNIKVSEMNTDYTKSIPIGREGKLSEIGDLCVYLASKRGGYISGTTVNASGGKSRG